MTQRHHCINTVGGRQKGHTDTAQVVLAFTMTSAESQEILNELNNVSMKMQQLLEQKKVLCIMKELKDRVCYEPTGERQDNEQELNNIDKELEMLEARRANLQQRYDLINGADLKPAKKVSFSNITLPDLKLSNSSPQVFFVEEIGRAHV